MEERHLPWRFSVEMFHRSASRIDISRARAQEWAAGGYDRNKERKKE
jgi:hypothetical protein